MQQYTTVEASVSLSGGTQTLRLYTEGASFTVNRLEIVTPPGTNNYALQLNNHPANGGGFISDAVNDFTVEFWIKAAGTHQIDVESNSLSNVEGVAGQRYAIFPVHGYGSGDAGMGVSVGTNGVSVYEHADGYMPPLLVWESSTPLTDWTHVAIVYRNKQPSLYINGNWVKDGQVSQKNNVYAGLQFPGGHYGGTGGEQMDEVRVWKYARTEQQIRDNRQGEILGTTPGLAGYWPMNEGSGTVLHDISGNGWDIDLSSAGYNNSNWVSGRYTVSNQEDLYRYAFNSKERDQDIGEDNYDYGMRIHDARLGRFLSVDPLAPNYPWNSTYAYSENDPVNFTDIDGAGKGESKSNANNQSNAAFLRGSTDALRNAQMLGAGDKLPDWLGGTNHLNDYSSDYLKSAYLRGRLAGDATAVAIAHAEMTGGAGMMQQGGAVVLATGGGGGVTAAVGGGEAIVGGLIAGHGALTVYHAGKDAIEAGKKLFQLNAASTDATNPGNTSQKKASQVHGGNSGASKNGSNGSSAASGETSAGNLIRTETPKGNSSARTVGANMKILNDGGNLAPVEVANVNNKMYIINGHHRVEASLRTSRSVRYKILTKAEWQSYGYRTESDIVEAASVASSQRVKLDNKIVKTAASKGW